MDAHIHTTPTSPPAEGSGLYVARGLECSTPRLGACIVCMPPEVAQPKQRCRETATLHGARRTFMPLRQQQHLPCSFSRFSWCCLLPGGKWTRTSTAEPTADHVRSRGHVGAVEGSGRSPELPAVRLIHRYSCVYLGASLGVSA